MQKKIPYPEKGVLIIDGHTYTLDKKYTYIPGRKRCDVKGCKKKYAYFYGYETIGPRVYLLHKCAEHGLQRTRIISDEGTLYTAK
jgi:hypothetical protein